MKRKSPLTLLLFAGFLLLLLNTSCRKEKTTEASHPDFIGDWYAVDGTDAYIEFIIGDGTATWAKTDGVVNSNISGKLKISERRDILKLTVKKFKIDSYPKVTNDGWTMILDGITFERD